MELRDVEKLADLARIKMSKEEMEEILIDLGSILNYIDQISSVNITDSTEEEYIVKNVFREDTEMHDSQINTKDLLNEAPDTENNYIKVKKIL